MPEAVPEPALAGGNHDFVEVQNLQQTFRRIENDVMRYRLQRAGAVVWNPQT